MWQMAAGRKKYRRKTEFYEREMWKMSENIYNLVNI